MALRATTIIALAVAAACGGVLGSPESIRDGGSDDAEGAAIAADASGFSDAAVRSDASGPVDDADAAQPDAGSPDAAYPATGSCAQISDAQWCENWDFSTTPSGVWTMHDTGGAFVAIETTDAISAPNVLHATYPSAGATVNAAFLARGATVGSAFNCGDHLVIDFDVRFDSVSLSATVDFLLVEEVSLGQITVSLAAGEVQVAIFGQPGVQTTSVVSQGVAYHGTLKLSLCSVGDPGPWVATLDMGSLGVATTSAKNLPGYFDNVQVEVGVLGTSGSADGAATGVRIDNIVVR